MFKYPSDWTLTDESFEMPYGKQQLTHLTAPTPFDNSPFGLSFTQNSDSLNHVLCCKVFTSEAISVPGRTATLNPVTIITHGLQNNGKVSQIGLTDDFVPAGQGMFRFNFEPNNRKYYLSFVGGFGLQNVHELDPAVFESTEQVKTARKIFKTLSY